MNSKTEKSSNVNDIRCELMEIWENYDSIHDRLIKEAHMIEKYGLNDIEIEAILDITQDCLEIATSLTKILRLDKSRLGKSPKTEGV